MGNYSEKSQNRNESDTIVDYITTLQSKKQDYMKQNIKTHDKPIDKMTCGLMCSWGSNPTQPNSGKWKEHILKELNSSYCQNWPKTMIKLINKVKNTFYHNIYQQEVLWIHMNNNILKQPIVMPYMMSKKFGSNPVSNHSSLLDRNSDSGTESLSNIAEDFKEELKGSLYFPNNKKVGLAFEETAILEEKVLEAHDHASVLGQYYDIDKKSISHRNNQNFEKNPQKILSDKDNPNTSDKSKKIPNKKKLKKGRSDDKKKTENQGNKSFEEFRNNTFINTLPPTHRLDNESRRKEDEMLMNINHYKTITNAIEKHLNDSNNLFCMMIQAFADYFIKHYTDIMPMNHNENMNEKGVIATMTTMVTEECNGESMKGYNKLNIANGICGDSKNEFLSKRNEDIIKELESISKQGINDICQFIRILYETLNIFYDIERIRHIDNNRSINTLFCKDNLINFLTSILFKKTCIKPLNNKLSPNGDISLSTQQHHQSFNNPDSNDNGIKKDKICNGGTGVIDEVIRVTLDTKVELGSIKCAIDNISIYNVMMSYFYKQESEHEANFKKAIMNLAALEPEEFGIEPKFCLNHLTLKYIQNKYPDAYESKMNNGLSSSSTSYTPTNKTQKHESYQLINLNNKQKSDTKKTSKMNENGQDTNNRSNSLFKGRLLDDQASDANNHKTLITNLNTSNEGYDVSNNRKEVVHNDKSDMKAEVLHDAIMTPKVLNSMQNMGIITEANEPSITPNFSSSIDQMIKQNKIESKKKKENSSKYKGLQINIEDGMDENNVISNNSSQIKSQRKTSSFQLKTSGTKIQSPSNQLRSPRTPGKQPLSPQVQLSIRYQEQPQQQQQQPTTLCVKKKDATLESSINIQSIKEIPYLKAINILKTLDQHYSPIHKLKIITKAAETICLCIREFYENYGVKDIAKLDGDQTLSIFMYLISKTTLYTLPSQCNFIVQFTTSNIMNSISGYYATTLEASISSMIAMTNHKCHQHQQRHTTSMNNSNNSMSKFNKLFE